MPTYNRFAWLAGIKQLPNLKLDSGRGHADATAGVADPYYIAGHLDDGARHYFTSVLKKLEKKTKEEIKVIVGQVITDLELQTQPIPLVCKDSVGSRVFEILCSIASEGQLLVLLKLVQPHFSVLVGNATTSFVLQTLLKFMAPRFRRENSPLRVVFYETVQVLKGKWEDLFYQGSTSFVARTIIRLIGDLPQTDDEIVKELAQKQPTPQPQAIPVLREITDELLRSKKPNPIFSCCLNANAGACLLALALALKYNDTEFYEKLVLKSFGGKDKIKKKCALITSNAAAVRTFEVLFATVGTSVVFSYLAEHFVNKYHIKKSANSEGSKCLLRASFISIREASCSEEQIAAILDAYLESLSSVIRYAPSFIPDILDIGIRWPKLQHKIYASFLVAMWPRYGDDDEANAFAYLLYYGQSYGVGAQIDQFSHLGVLVLRYFWKFSLDVKKPLLRSVYKSDPELLSRAACSRWQIFSKMFERGVPVVVANKLAKCLIEITPKLIENPFGAFFLLQLFRSAGTKYKSLLAKELLASLKSLKGTPQGNALITRLQLDQYESDKDSWLENIKRVPPQELSKKEMIAIKREYKKQKEEIGGEGMDMDKDVDVDMNMGMDMDTKTMNNKRKRMENQHKVKNAKQLPGLHKGMYIRMLNKAKRNAKRNVRLQQKKFYTQIKIEKSRIDKLRGETATKQHKSVRDRTKVKRTFERKKRTEIV